MRCARHSSLTLTLERPMCRILPSLCSLPSALTDSSSGTCAILRSCLERIPLILKRNTYPPSENSRHLADFQGTLELTRDFGPRKTKLRLASPRSTMRRVSCLERRSLDQSRTAAVGVQLAPRRARPRQMRRRGARRCGGSAAAPTAAGWLTAGMLRPSPKKLRTVSMNLGTEIGFDK